VLGKRQNNENLRAGPNIFRASKKIGTTVYGYIMVLMPMDTQQHPRPDEVLQMTDIQASYSPEEAHASFMAASAKKHVSDYFAGLSQTPQVRNALARLAAAPVQPLYRPVQLGDVREDGSEKYFIGYAARYDYGNVVTSVATRSLKTIGEVLQEYFRSLGGPVPEISATTESAIQQFMEKVEGAGTWMFTQARPEHGELKRKRDTGVCLADPPGISGKLDKFYTISDSQLLPTKAGCMIWGDFAKTDGSNGPGGEQQDKGPKCFGLDYNK